MEWLHLLYRPLHCEDREERKEKRMRGKDGHSCPQAIFELFKGPFVCTDDKTEISETWETGLLC